MKTSRHFKPSEFEKCVPTCSIEHMEQDFLDMIDRLRDEAGIPLKLSCAFRSVAWDKAKGRTGDSAHTMGRAVDIVCNADATRMKIVQAAIKVGFRRIGIEGRFVHVDNAPAAKKSQDIIWVY